MELILLLEILRRRKRLFLSVMLAVFLAFILACHLLPDVYEAKSKVLISSTDTVSRLLNAMEIITPDVFTEAENNSTKQKELTTLMPLFEELVKRLELRNIWGRPMEPEKLTGLHFNFWPNPHVEVDESGNSVDVIEIVTTSTDREEAACMANVLADLFIASESERVRKDFELVGQSIARCLEQAKMEYAELQQLLKTKRTESEAINLESETNNIMQRLNEIESNIDDNDLLIVQLDENIKTSRQLLQSIKQLRDMSYTLSDTEELTDLKLKLNDYLLSMARGSVELTENHPAFKIAKKQAEEAKSLIDREDGLSVTSVRRTVDPLYDVLNGSLHQAKISLASARAQISVLQQLRERHRARLTFLAKKYQGWAGLNLDIASSQSRYQTLRGMALKIDVFRSLALSSMKIVERAKPPRRRIFPKKKIFYPAGLFLGIFLAFGAVLLPEYVDNTIRRPDQIRDLWSGPFVQVVPSSKRIGKNETVTALNSMSPVTESLRNVKGKLLLANGGKLSGSVMVTSSVNGEGKSTLVANLALLFAQGGIRTLAMDVDIRSRGLEAMFRARHTFGLVEVLRGEMPLETAVFQPGQDNLDVLLCGSQLSDPSVLAGSPEMHGLLVNALGVYDVVLMDGPPLLFYADTEVLLGKATTCLYVVESGRASLSMIRDARELLEKAGIHVSGIVLNKYVNFMPFHYNSRFNKPASA